MAHKLRWLIVVLASGCFSEPSNMIKCDAENACPEGQVCDGNVCVANSSGSDMGVADFAIASVGCRNGTGTQSGVGFACAGPCTMGQCDRLCADTYQICPSATGLDLAKLATLNGFFVANVAAYYFSPQRSVTNCGSASGTAIPVIFGAGKNQMYVTENQSRQCAGFAQSADCGLSPRLIQCTAPYDSSKIAVESAQNGVLCCPK